MKYRQTDTPPVAAAKASFSSSTVYRLEKDPRLPSQKTSGRDRRRPDPLAGVFETEIVSMRKGRPWRAAGRNFSELTLTSKRSAVSRRDALRLRVPADHPGLLHRPPPQRRINAPRFAHPLPFGNLADSNPPRTALAIGRRLAGGYGPLFSGFSTVMQQGRR